MLKCTKKTQQVEGLGELKATMVARNTTTDMVKYWHKSFGAVVC